MKYLAAINLLAIAKIESFAPLPGYLVPTSIGHHIHEGQRLGRSSKSQVSLIPLQVAKVPSTSSANEDDTMDDDTLLKEITESQLQPRVIRAKQCIYCWFEGRNAIPPQTFCTRTSNEG